MNKFETIRGITLQQYIDYYFDEVKPSNWDEINQQSNEITGGTNESVFLDLYKKFLKLQIQQTIKRLHGEPENGFDSLKIQVIARDLDIIAKQQHSDQMTHEKFSVWIFSVSKFLGYQVKQAEISLFDFLVASREMKKFNEALTKQSKR